MLKQENIDVSQHQPRRVAADELQSAGPVISMGCRAEELDMSPTRVEQWNIPAVSQNPQAVQEAILEHIEALITEL